VPTAHTPKLCSCTGVKFEEELYEQLVHSQSMDYEMSHFLMDLMGLEPRRMMSRISTLPTMPRAPTIPSLEVEVCVDS
jgi:hypothetical protein